VGLCLGDAQALDAGRHADACDALLIGHLDREAYRDPDPYFNPTFGWSSGYGEAVGLPVVIDLLHLGRPRSVAAYLIRGPEPILVDCGPATCLGALQDALARQGMTIDDLRHLLLTHIHLDHAGAAGALVQANPRLIVHVSALGAPHLIDPSRLHRSSRRLFGGDFDRLWGPLLPIPAANVRVAEHEAAGLDCFATPGHATHHVTFVDGGGNCYAGDTTGVRVSPVKYVAGAAPPPDIDIPAYLGSLDAIEERAPARLCLSHFGIYDDVEDHLDCMRGTLTRWSAWVRDGATEEEFVARARAELAHRPDVLEEIETAAPFPPSYAGLKRYWENVG
jgi:glyoxylase-like metal-dependent hydrolase (beta-lactamase superfamily II)